jgi:hypothetical protein
MFTRSSSPRIRNESHSWKVRALLDPQGRGRQFTAARLVQLTGTRAGGFVLTRQEAAGKWGKATYSLVRTAVKAA